MVLFKISTELLHCPNKQFKQPLDKHQSPQMKYFFFEFAPVLIEWEGTCDFDGQLGPIYGSI